MNLLPRARSSELVVQEFGKELLVYDLMTDQAYQLNEPLLIVFQACDGSTSFDDLESKLKFTDDLIYLALDELNSANLLTGYESTHFAGLSRRQAIRQVGLACAAALPVIIGITAPAAIDAASGKSGVNATCTSNAQCSTNRCVSTKTLTITADGTGSTNSPSGKKQCCVPDMVATPDSNGSTYPANDQFSCGFFFVCCSGTGSVSATPNSGGYYTCTCD